MCHDSVLIYEREGETAERYGSKDFWESRYHRRRMEAVWDILRELIRPRDTFIDAGCGTGEYLLLAGNTLGADIYGLDVSTSYLRRARASGIQVIRADVSHLPFRKAIFDVALCSEVLEHVEVPIAAAIELLRIARRYVVISAPNFGILRVIARMVFPGLTDQLDRSVGHVSVQKIGRLTTELSNSQWHMKLQRTLHIAPPYLSRLGIPSFFSGLVHFAEKALEAGLPLLGNVSVLVFGSGSESVNTARSSEQPV